MTRFTRPFLRLTPAAALLLALTACTTAPPDAAAPSHPAGAASAGERQTPPQHTPPGSDRNPAMDIRVALDGHPVEAFLNDSPAAWDLAALLPLTLELKDFHGIERIGYPPRTLTTDGAPEPAAATAGDLAYYAPWGNLALFSADGPAADADLLILGHLEAGAEQLARAERITLTPA
ncbi:cyclophilin-like fold protein [Streptomyces sp. NPDC055189]